MKQKVWNIFKAFFTGFIVVSAVLLALQVLAPLFGVELEVGWKATFELEKSSRGVLYASWLAPLTVGLIFAAIQLVDDFESDLSRLYTRKVKSYEAREAVAVLWHGFLGLAVGFVVSMFLLALLSGSVGVYSIPFLLTAEAQGASVEGTTSIMTITTILGIIWGVWKAEHLPKKKKKVNKRKKK